MLQSPGSRTEQAGRSATPANDAHAGTAAVADHVKEIAGLWVAASRGAGWSVRLREKGEKHHTMPCRLALAEARCTPISTLRELLTIEGWLFRTARVTFSRQFGGPVATEPKVRFSKNTGGIAGQR